MFQLYDQTRRRICVAAFLTLGVLPTLLVGGWCWSRHTRGCLQAEAEQLSRQLGLNVKLAGMKHLRPGVVLYEQFAAVDPETGRPIFRCRLLEIARQTPRGSPAKRRPTLLLTVSQPEVDAASLDRVWQCLQRSLEGLCGPLEADVQFSAAELTLRADGNSQTLTEVNGAVESLPEGTHARLDFRLVGANTPEPAHICVTRNRQVSPPASGFELRTGGELPCSLLAMGLSELKPLGGHCRFRGIIWANETPDGWQGEVTGRLVDLDLGGLVSDHFPHKLSGAGEATIDSARFRHGRLEEGSALVVAGPGRIDRSLLVAAVDRLGLAPAAESPPDGDLVEYKQLAFSATLDTEGLTLHGRCDTAEQGTILSDGRHRLLGESQQQPTPVVALVRTLVPQSAVQVPASRQTDWLLHHLPVPEVMPLPGAEAVAPRAQVRLRNAWQR